MMVKKEHKEITKNNMLQDNVLGSAGRDIVRLLTRTYKCMVYFVAVFDEFSGCM